MFGGYSKFYRSDTNCFKLIAGFSTTSATASASGCIDTFASLETPDEGLIAALGKARTRAGGGVEKLSVFTLAIVLASLALAAALVPDSSAGALLHLGSAAVRVLHGLPGDSRANAHAHFRVPVVVWLAVL